MKKKTVIIFITLFCAFGIKSFAQKEKNIWYFGDYAGLDFNSGSPVALSNSNMWQNEGCASISDANGNILFYTNGDIVWDRNHVIMPNGDNLGGGVSATQSALIVPLPGSSTIYYIFTVGDSEGLIHDFSYSIVDMTLNLGDGDVTSKHVLIGVPVTEKLTAVMHANNVDVWVMVRGLNNNSFYCYRITPAGITASPCVSSLGTVITNNDNNIIGYMKFSPDGTKIALTAGSTTGYVELFDFNPATGYVFNDKYLNVPPSTGLYGPYGLEFSVSGNYLYAAVVDPGFIYQWDVTSNSAAVINATLQQITPTPSINDFGALQLGPDGKIYCSKPVKNSVAAIANPELPGVLCNYVDSIILLTPGDVCMHGFPNFITSYFLTTGVSESNPDQNQFTISPNPASEQVTITGDQSEANEVYQITISDITGRHCLQTQDARLPVTININHLQQGIYFVELYKGEKYFFKKIVIEKD